MPAGTVIFTPAPAHLQVPQPGLQLVVQQHQGSDPLVAGRYGGLREPLPVSSEEGRARDVHVRRGLPEGVDGVCRGGGCGGGQFGDEAAGEGAGFCEGWVGEVGGEGAEEDVAGGVEGCVVFWGWVADGGDEEVG